MQILFRASLAHSVTESNPTSHVNYLNFFPFFFISRKVSESGNYTFFVACDDTCELSLRTEREEHLEQMEENEASGKQLLIKLDHGTHHNQWNK